ncbi:hypothetical protein PICST_31918 [Scheffersomyces stipitis CBS 6054]|uniref:Uncharacterized protein n=1 Tax=Scheffersomyces stipitis (strain ATCC 58785 / CBS 6054 / NBRC 10063 / NRRL Y-11545) TaxID=322104 RepID=A3LUX1_PICST|nr:hypothetical protein PICST_31918 [Scheffersomyces stipitis CBS 6054]ABN67029.2 hypothetical protein PICST_31918 [Scheffersomyces stipitis CBS 6054]KAG2731283.1 hypothetical protein G9P44_005699 [Scheffersomyces stipitis]
MNVAILFLSLIISSFAESIPVETQVPTVRHHHHHNHHKDRQQILVDIGSPAPTIALVQRDGSMPTITGKPTLAATSSATSSSSTTSYSYSIAIPVGNEKSSGSPSNPYIYSSSLPDNLVFIVVGAIAGLLLIILILFRLITWIIARRRAKSEKEVYFANFNSGGFYAGSSSASSFNGLTTPSNSSFLEKASMASTSNLLLSKHNSIIQSHFEDSSNSSSSQQGRSYRDAVMGNNNSNANLSNANKRGSMFISPVLEVMHSRSASQLELPLYHKSIFQAPNGSVLSLLDPGTPTSTNNNDSLNYDIYGAEKFNLLQNYTNSDIESNGESVKPQQQPKRSRPPSQYLEDLLNGEL